MIPGAWGHSPPSHRAVESGWSLPATVPSNTPVGAIPGLGAVIRRAVPIEQPGDLIGRDTSSTQLASARGFVPTSLNERCGIGCR